MENKNLSEDKLPDKPEEENNKGGAGRRLTSAERQQLYAERARSRVHTERLRRRRGKITKITVIVTSAVVLLALIIGGTLVIDRVILPQRRYDAAAALFDAGDYLKAYDGFTALGDYRDAAARAADCIVRNAQALTGREDVLIGSTATMPWYTVDESGAIKLDSETYVGGSEVAVPDVFDGVLVRAIAEKGFYRADFMTAVTIPPSVSSVGNHAFFACTSLTEMVLPDSVTEIAESAFDQCTALVSVQLGEGLETIGQRAFIDCIALGEIVIPEGVGVIGYRAFNNCLAMKKLSLPRSLTTVGGYAFTGCDALESVTYPGSRAALEALFSAEGGTVVTGCPGLVTGE